MPADDPGELDARQKNRIKMQSSSFLSLGFEGAAIDHPDQAPAGVPYFARRRKVA
jgi:hypothetical protein